MTSRRQLARDQYDHIFPFIEEASNEYYGGNVDRGFRHWAFATVFTVGHDIQGNDIVEYTAIDGSDDFEIDGYFVPESDDDSVVHLFQSKHRQPETTMGPRELAAFLNAPNRVLNANEVAASNNEETKALHDELIKRLTSRDSRPSINLVWTTSGTLSRAARRTAEENRSRKLTFDIDGNPYEVTVTLECLDLADLHEQHSNQQTSDDRFAPCDFTFHLEPNSYHETFADTDYHTVSMTVPVKQIIDVFAVHSYKIFRLNPRGPLGNKVNTSIKRTLLDEIDRRRFHLLNNGITAICESYRLENDRLSVRDFQIINGCQTAVTLWDARASIQGDASVLVTVKLTECPANFAETIARTTNRQTALRAEDFVSNDDVQNRLQREFRAMIPPWFYEIKRGEWAKMLGGASAKEIYRDALGGYRKLTSKEIAQSMVSFAGFPGESKDKIRNFLNSETVSAIGREGSISYQEIYTDQLSASQLLLPALVQRKVWQRVIEERKNDPSLDWLDYARFHIVWIIGDILRTHYQLSGKLFPEERAIIVTGQLNNWFEPIYAIAVTTIAHALDESRRANTFTGYREFFRSPSRYRNIETNVQSAIRLAVSVGNSPTARLPL